MMKGNRVMMIGFMVMMAIFVSSLPGYGFDLWPDTGQAKCYDDTVEISCPQSGEPFYGQDAQYSGPSRSYTKLGQGDVELPDSATYADGWIMTRDNVTGLIWEMKTDDNTIHDKDNTYTWCDSNPATNGGNAGTCGTDTDTEDFISALNTVDFGGHHDWRLPGIKELSSLTDSSIPDPGPAIDATYFPDTVASLYWSSTTYAYETYYAWRVFFGNGGVDYYLYKSDSYHVRAVRGGQSQAAYTDNNDGTVTDTSTGLMWQKCSMGQIWNGATNGCDGTAQAYDWQTALMQSENLSLAGHGDWRLPSRHELQSLEDYARADTSTGSAYFPGSSSLDYWSSTSSATYAGGAWVVHFNFGFVSYTNKSTNNDVRAVRGGLTIPIVGDWDGDGSDDVGLFSGSRFRLDDDEDGVADEVVAFGTGTDTPVIGDWNGDGVDDIGVFRGAERKFYLDSNRDGVADSTVTIGRLSDLPVVGDWDSDGVDDIGVFRPSVRRYYMDYNEDGIHDRAVTIGRLGDISLAGDWDGDGVDSIGVFRPDNKRFYLDDDDDGIHDHAQSFGRSTDLPIVGDWDGDGDDDIGVYRPSTNTFYLDENFDTIAETVVAME
ncbi:MAG: DUF1566 domain-containing protein [Deltaproteobacteria bacterium]|nr:DUF1566 domain-containing protein [Deltaproteobacteria bacterium]